MSADPRALHDQKSFYDERYSAGYMDGFEYDVYERCRLHTIREILPTVGNPSRILDYGCGQGRYLPEVRAIFPNASLFGCDISGVNLARRKVPYAQFTEMENETAPFPDNSFDLVLSVEVLEHVGDVALAVREIVRVLEPGGVAVITTPCANRFSLEWLINWKRGGLQSSHDGYGRFSTDEPGHLRRLTSDALADAFWINGAHLVRFYFRSHFFTTALERVPRLSLKTRARISLWDWHLFKHFPNGATMVAVFRKPSD
jgi:SAM-dependent methyltransferase